MSMARKTLAVGAAGVTLLGLGATAAQADPPAGTVPTATDIVGVGSDTTQDAMNKLGAAYNATNPTDKVYSWDATGTSPIVVKDGASPIVRPNGSSDGISKLLDPSMTDVIDYARSSRARKSSDAGTIFLPFAKDVLKYATATTTNAPQNLTKAQLTSIYRCTATTWSQVVPGASTATIQAKLPQAGSGTRATFLADLGLTDTTVGGCVDQSVQEHDPAPIAGNPNAIAPFSEGRYTILTNPGIKLNAGGYSLSRNLYNVVRDDDANPANGGVPARLQPFFGDGAEDTGWICSADAVPSIQAAGFQQLTFDEGCGAAE